MAWFPDRQTDLGRGRRSNDQPNLIKRESSDGDNLEQPVKPRSRITLGKIIVVLVFLYGVALVIGDFLATDILTIIKQLLSWH